MYRIGYAPGAFDLVHIGHLDLFRQAKSQCDFLIAGVASDELKGLVEGDSNGETVKAEMKQVAKIISARRF
jgi:cytidyltransferase-like protein